MTDQTQVDDSNEVVAAPVDELALLKQRAKMMGIAFSNNISLDTLKERIRQRMENGPDRREDVQAAELAEDDFPAAAPAVSPAAKKQSLRDQIYKENMRLIRLRITNLDPKKRELPGEIFTIANEYLGTVRKFIPFGSVTDSGYHVPYCIYKALKRRQFLSITTRKVPGTDRTSVEQRLVPEFALEVLAPLTPQDIAKLAASQAAAGGVT